MDKNRKENKNKFDSEAYYLVPMVSIGATDYFKYTELIKTKIKVDGNTITVKVNGYMPITFDYKFFISLLNKGIIKKV